MLAASISGAGATPKFPALAASKGSNMLAVAVLEATSDNATVSVQTMRKIMNGCISPIPVKRPAIVFDNPLASIPNAMAKPPPSNIRRCQGIPAARRRSSAKRGERRDTGINSNAQPIMIATAASPLSWRNNFSTGGDRLASGRPSISSQPNVTYFHQPGIVNAPS